YGVTYVSYSRAMRLYSSIRSRDASSGSNAWRMAPRLHGTFTDPSPASHLMHAFNPRGNGPHDSDISTAPRNDPERLDGLSTRAAGEGPRGVRSPVKQVEA